MSSRLFFLLLFFITSTLSNAQIQIGSDIDGEAAGDHSGKSVSMPDTNTVAIGASANGSFAGHVRIYTWDGSTWVQKGVDIDGEAAEDYSGTSVSMPDANTVAIGAPYNDGNGSNAGHVRIYTWNGSSWVQKGADIDGEATDDNSGISVSMPDANTVAIGADQNDGNGSNAGHVRIYTWNGTAWVQKGADIDGENTGDKSGFSVSMPDANTVAIGAYRNDGSGFGAGHVRIYTWDGSTWVQKGADIDGEAAEDYSGRSISMPDANTVAIGAYRNDGNGSDAGHVRIYTWDGSTWGKRGADIDGEAAGDKSGASVSMPNADTVAIGAPFNEGNGTEAGHLRVYDLCGTPSSISPVACTSYTVPSGDETYTTSGTYKDTIPNAAGCDSLITIDLTINNADTSVTPVDPTTLEAVDTSASYQWLDCGNGYSAISGETGQQFTASSNGSYAVELTKNGCTDTSGCHQITEVGIAKNELEGKLSVHPNPTTDKVTVELLDRNEKLHVKVRDASGRLVRERDIDGPSSFQLELGEENGLYLVELWGNDGKNNVIRVVKE